MKTIKQTAKGGKHVGIFFHVDKKCTVITTVDPDSIKRGDLAYDKHGRMICRAVYNPADGDPAYDVKYEVTKLLDSVSTKPAEPEEITDMDYNDPVDENGLSDEPVAGV